MGNPCKNQWPENEDKNGENMGCWRGDQTPHVSLLFVYWEKERKSSHIQHERCIVMVGMTPVVDFLFLEAMDIFDSNSFFFFVNKIKYCLSPHKLIMKHGQLQPRLEFWGLLAYITEAWNMARAINIIYIFFSKKI